MNDCLTEAVIDAHLAGEVGDDVARRVAQHLTDCSRCAALAAQLRSRHEALIPLLRAGRGDGSSGPTETAAAPPERDLGHPARIGPYRILDVSGEGGMGIVYLAEQTEPVRRKVAIKVIRPGMDTRQVIARFEAERQALALMEHAHVARILDAGTTEQQRPFFVMEHVAGERITSYCDKRTMSIPDRLRLFMQVCEGIQHAHQKGIIHRDIKPSNVLVTQQDGLGVPKVIDFGIAKALHQPLTDSTLHTFAGQPIGTPGYMSPEQLDPTWRRVDTRTDVYSLGVLLYELLTGLLPFDRELLQRSTADAIRGMIDHTGAPGPYERLNTSSGGLRDAARNRGSEPAALLRQLRADLSWITLQAIEKDPERRYASAAALADDVGRHLRHEPVEAGPRSRTYRLTKFVRRNPLAVGATTLVTILTIAYATTMTLAFRKATSAEKLAESRLEETSAVQRFFDSMLNEAGGKIDAKTFKFVDVLGKADAFIQKDLRDKPLLEADFRGKISGYYKQVGLYEPADKHLEKAIQIRADVFGPGAWQTLIMEADRALLYGLWEHSEEAESLFRSVLQRCRVHLGEEAWLTCWVQVYLADVLADLGKLDEADSLYRSAQEAFRKRPGPEYRDYVKAMANYLVFLEANGRYDEGLALGEENLSILSRTLGDDHQRTLNVMHNLAMFYKKRQRLAEAERIQRRILQVTIDRFGDDQPFERIKSLNNLATTLYDQGKVDEFIPLFRQTYDLARRADRPDHRSTFIAMTNLAEVLTDFGDLDEAEALARQSVDGRKKLLGENDPQLFESDMILGVILVRKNQLDEAFPLLTTAVEGFEKRLGKNHPNTGSAKRGLASLYARRGELELAATMAQEALNALAAGLDENHYLAARARADQAIYLARLQRYEEAEPELLRAHDKLKGQFGDQHPFAQNVLCYLVELYDDWGKPDQAEPHRQRLSRECAD